MIWKCEGQEILDYSKFYKFFITEQQFLQTDKNNNLYQCDTRIT